MSIHLWKIHVPAAVAILGVIPSIALAAAEGEPAAGAEAVASRHASEKLAAEISGKPRGEQVAAVLRQTASRQQARARKYGKAPRTRQEMVDDPLPGDLALASVARGRDGRWVARLTGSFGQDPYAAGSSGSEDLEEIQKSLLLGDLAEAGIYDVDIQVKDPVTGRFRRLGGTFTRADDELREEQSREWSRQKALREEEDAAGEGSAARTVKAGKFPKGAALLGKRILVSPGHGWTESSRMGWSGSGWGWQRGMCKFSSSARGILEDLSNARFVNQWLIPVLENMGAEVVLVRESDMTTDGAVIDNGASGYSESGTFADGGLGPDASGYRQAMNNAFRHSNIAGVSAKWSKSFSTSGYRRFQVWFPEGGDRPGAVDYTVNHAGGSTTFTVDQTRFGRMFHDLGSFWCAAGKACGVTAKRSSSSGTMIADAVKVGGEIMNYSGSATVPWWQVDAWYYVHDKVLGTRSPELTGYGVSTRSQFANRAGADLYVSIHSNATSTSCDQGGTTANGMVTYIYQGTLQDGTKLFADLAHTSAVAHVRSDYDPYFQDRGIQTGDLGELHWGTMPSILIETAFHSNLTNPSSFNLNGQTVTPQHSDNYALHDPRWREAVARGIADAAVQYFKLKPTGSAAGYVKGSGVPPARPTGLKAVNAAKGCSLKVSWDKTAGATGYRLYRIDNVRPGYERAFDAGTVVDTNSVTLTDLKPGKVYAFRVAALNANGEGFPSPAVTARFLSVGETVDGLYVNGYDRRDAYVQEEDNDLSYAAEHGIALGAVAADFYFDGAVKDAVEGGAVKLSDYAVVDWQTGQNSTEHHSLSATAQSLLTSYLDAGGRLLVSGAELAWDLGNKGNGTAFLKNQLKAAYAADDAGVYAFSGTGPFAGLSGLTFDNGTHGTYDVMYPDTLSASGGTGVMTYDGTGAIAAVEGPKTIAMGFPIEAIYPASSRAKVMACGIGRLLNGSSWTCKASGVTAPSDGAPEGTCESEDPPEPADAGTPDAGKPDAGAHDAGTPDAGTPDAGTHDAGAPDAGTPDAGTHDAGPVDSGTTPVVPDAGPQEDDAGHPGEPTDAGGEGPLDEDSGPADPEAMDLSELVIDTGCGCDTSSPSDIPPLAALASLLVPWLLVPRRRP